MTEEVNSAHYVDLHYRNGWNHTVVSEKVETDTVSRLLKMTGVKEITADASKFKEVDNFIVSWDELRYITIRTSYKKREDGTDNG